MKFKGFTLIEILVAMSVMLSATGFIVVSYNSFNTAEKLRQTGKTLRNNLRFIQTRAAAGLKPDQGANCSTLRGYQVTFSEGSYSYAALCDGVEPQGGVTIALPSEIRFQPVPADIIFQVLTGNSNGSAVLALAGGAKGYQIYVDSSGDISDMGNQPIITIVPSLRPDDPNATPTNTPTHTATPKPQATVNPYTTHTPTITQTPTPSSTGIPTATLTPTNILQPTANPTAVPTTAPVWVAFCNEWQTCGFEGTRTIRYGLINGLPSCGYSASKTFSNSVACNNFTFGDPCFGYGKQCEYLYYAPTATPIPTATSTPSVTPIRTPTPTPRYVFLCNAENLCWFNGDPVTRTIRYGVPNCGYATPKVSSNNVFCTVGNFGSDPCPGRTKQCEYLVP